MLCVFVFTQKARMSVPKPEKDSRGGVTTESIGIHNTPCKNWRLKSQKRISVQRFNAKTYCFLLVYWPWVFFVADLLLGGSWSIHWPKTIDSCVLYASYASGSICSKILQKLLDRKTSFRQKHSNQWSDTWTTMVITTNHSSTIIWYNLPLFVVQLPSRAYI